MDFNLKALGAETVMVDRRLVAKLVEAELLLRDGEKLPYEEELIPSKTITGYGHLSTMTNSCFRNCLLKLPKNKGSARRV